jgi:polyisoprenyl-phosphate glycosyltransferase
VTDPLLSILVPVFNESDQIGTTIDVLCRILDEARIRFEILVVDDGSTDATWVRLSEISATNVHVHALQLSRNFGKEAALCAGIDAVRGDAVVVMDADLQHPPELIPEMVRLWCEERYPIVEAVKRHRGKEGVFNRLGARLFYKMLRSLAALDLREASDFKLLDGHVVAIWRSLRERETFFRGLTAWVGFPRAKIYFEVPERLQGRTRWSKWRLIKLAITALTSFSAVPLQVVTTLGLIFLVGAIPMGIQTLYMKFSGRAVSGFTTVITLQLMIGSILMISLGIIGTYIARIFEEVKHRPRYLVAARCGLPQQTGAGANPPPS